MIGACIAEPFPGLRPFTKEESTLFFGRDEQVEDLLIRLAGRCFLAVVGTSGSGKSSLVRAGLIPTLQRGHLGPPGSEWVIATVSRPGVDPVHGLACALADAFRQEESQLPEIEAVLNKSSIGLADVARKLLRERQRLFILVDQFEEIFRYRRQFGAEGRIQSIAFVKLLLTATGHSELVPLTSERLVYSVLTMRSDYLGKCAQFRGLPEALNDSQYLVPQMSRDQLREAIEGPVVFAGAEISGVLVDRLLNDAGDDPDRLPVLQHALSRVWEESADSRANGVPLDLSHYESERVGGMRQALNLDAEAVLKTFKNETEKRIARRMFQRLIEPGREDEETRRPTRLSEISRVCGVPEFQISTIVNSFQSRGFLTLSAEKDPIVDISHESLIRQWETLKNWTKEETQDRDDYLYFAKRVERGGELFAGADLALALKWRDRKLSKEWAERYGGNFRATVEFIDRSCEVQERRRKAEVKRSLIRRITLFSATGMVLLTLLYGLWVNFEKQAKKQGRQEGLQQGEAAARAIAQGLTLASGGDFGAALKQFQTAGASNPTLPIEVLDQAVVDAQRKNDPALNNLRIARQYYVGSQGLVAVALNGKILRTDNGGKSWQALDIGTGLDLWSVAFATPQSGWVAGDEGAILHTEDGGRSWHGQTSGTSSNLGAVAFVNAQSGWVVGRHGTIQHTEDGGRTWKKQSIGVPNFFLLCLSFVNSQSGWVAGEKGTIVHTEDGGNSWHTQTRGVPAAETLRSLTFVTLQSGWAVGYDGTILHTEDGGDNWQNQNSGTDAWLFAVTFVSQQSGWVVGDRGTILHTEDGGRSWQKQNSGTNDQLHAVSFLTSQSGWVAGEKGTLLYTDDSGSSWRKQDNGTDANLYSITFIRQQ
jgi:photosystem II stability/assembly factor-like uncharacterized protein